ncbi:MAG: hypothetical protein US62_C0036G0001, partial [Candidatus Woesebacteria bacterium GW2011_GWA1_37_8]
YLFLIIDRPKVTKDQWIYFPDKEIPLFRFSEMKNFSSEMAPKDKTSLFVEYFCWQGDKMVVILVANNKLGFITEMKLWYSDNEENDWEAFNTFKMVPSKDKIRVRFKDQYGNISQVFSANVEFK